MKFDQEENFGGSPYYTANSVISQEGNEKFSAFVYYVKILCKQYYVNRRNREMEQPKATADYGILWVENEGLFLK